MLKFTVYILDDLVSDREINRGSPLFIQAQKKLANGPAVLTEADGELFEILSRHYALRHPPAAGRL